jgi:hypothetical protein
MTENVLTSTLISVKLPECDIILSNEVVTYIPILSNQV